MIFRPFKKKLIVILEDAKKYLALPDNDYSWSSWESPEYALQEIDGFITDLKNGRKINRLSLEVIFAATGPIQEVSLSSGWGKEFLTLAKRFDKTIKWLI